MTILCGQDLDAIVASTSDDRDGLYRWLRLRDGRIVGVRFGGPYPATDSFPKTPDEITIFTVMRSASGTRTVVQQRLKRSLIQGLSMAVTMPKPG
jgi:hypothetical protein